MGMLTAAAEFLAGTEVLLLIGAMLPPTLVFLVAALVAVAANYRWRVTLFSYRYHRYKDTPPREGQVWRGAQEYFYVVGFKHGEVEITNVHPSLGPQRDRVVWREPPGAWHERIEREGLVYLRTAG